MQDPKKLRVWHLARALALKIIDALPPGAARKVPGLRSQTIRAANSVHENLAEGCRRATRPEFLHFVEIALASLSETESELELARDARVLAEGTHFGLRSDAELIRRMVLSLIRRLQEAIAADESRQRPKRPARSSKKKTVRRRRR